MLESTKKQEVYSLSTKLQDTGADTFRPTLVQLIMSAAKSPGFWSGEIIAPADERQEWTLIQRFGSNEQAKNWMKSGERQILLARIGSLSNDGQAAVSDRILSTEASGSVATAIVTNVHPGMEDAYWQWEEKIQSAQAKFPGYAGSYLQPPAPGRPGVWTTMLRFDTPRALESWFSSPLRKQLLLEAEKFVKTTRFHNLSTSFPGWFPADRDTGELPPKWKTATLVFLGLFPVVVLLKRFMLPLLDGLNTTIAIAATTVGSVLLVTWMTMPVLLKVFNWWLLPRKDKLKLTAVGLCAAAILLLVEIILLWNTLSR